LHSTKSNNEDKIKFLLDNNSFSDEKRLKNKFDVDNENKWFDEISSEFKYIDFDGMHFSFII
jgi:hypothetical protein